MNILKYIGASKYLLIKLNEYYTNKNLLFSKKNKIKKKVYKKINKLIQNINKKNFFNNNDKYQKELILLIYKINTYTISYKKDENIEHFDFTHNSLKNTKIIQTIFLRYILNTSLKYISNKTNDAKISTITILNIIEYTAKNENIFNILNILNNIIDYLNSKKNIIFNQEYNVPHEINIKHKPVINKRVNFKTELKQSVYKNYNDTLYIFEDTVEKHYTNDKGKYDDYIRIYNFMGNNKIPLSAGISTDSKSQWVLDRDLTEIKELILKYKYKNIFYLTVYDDKKDTGLFYSKYPDTDNISIYISNELSKMKGLLHLYDGKNNNNTYHNITQIIDNKTPKLSLMSSLNVNVNSPKIEFDESKLFKFNANQINNISYSDSIHKIDSLDNIQSKIKQPSQYKEEDNLLPILISKGTSPKNKAKPPKNKAKPPKNKAKPPKNKAASPIAKAASTTFEAASPTSKAASPTSKAASPTSKAASPTSKAASPTSKAASPTSKTASPTSKAASPTSKAASPTSKAASPTSKAASPTSKAAPKQSVKSDGKIPQIWKKIQIIQSIWTANNRKGDFEWEIKQEISKPKIIKTNNKGKDTLYIFNDNHLHHETLEVGGGNGAIRPYNKYNLENNIYSAGLSTGWMPNNEFQKKDRIQWLAIINSEYEEIKILLETGRYNKVVYSTAADKNGNIINKDGVGILGILNMPRVDPEIRWYIPTKIHELQYININNNVNNFISYLRSNILRIELIQNNYIINNKIIFESIQFNDNNLYSYVTKNIKINNFMNIINLNTLNNLINIYELEKNIKHIKILKFLNKENDFLHYPILYETWYLQKSKKLMFFSQYLDNNLINFINTSKINNNIINIFINMIQQLLMAIIYYHSKTGLINTNINAKNIFYKKETTAYDKYINYKLFGENYYIKYYGYIWYLTDYSESIEMSNNHDILFNKNYDSYHMYFEFKVILDFFKKSKIYGQKDFFDEYIDKLLNNLTYEKIKNIYDKTNKLNIIDKELFNLIKGFMFFETIDLKKNHKIYNNKKYDVTIISTEENNKKMLLSNNIDNDNFKNNVFVIKNI